MSCRCSVRLSNSHAEGLGPNSPTKARSGVRLLAARAEPATYFYLYGPPYIIQREQQPSALRNECTVFKVATLHYPLHNLVKYSKALKYSIELAEQGPEEVEQDLRVHLQQTRIVRGVFSRRRSRSD